MFINMLPPALRPASICVGFGSVCVLSFFFQTVLALRSSYLSSNYISLCVGKFWLLPVAVAGCRLGLGLGLSLGCRLPLPVAVAGCRLGLGLGLGLPALLALLALQSGTR